MTQSRDGLTGAAIFLTKAQSRIVRDNPAAARLVANVRVKPSGCWEWSKSRDQSSYGCMQFRGRNWRTHRISFSIFCGEIPDGLFVCHHCDNPPCVNPSHLFLGNASVNMKDMVRKGRSATLISSAQDHFKSGHPPRGEDGSGAKLKEQQAAEIINRSSKGASMREICDEFGVNRTTVQRILRGETWRHLTRPPNLPRPTGVYASRAALAEEERR